MVLKCTVSPPPVLIQWTKNNVKIISGVSGASIDVKSVYSKNMVESILRIENLSPGHSGSYRCLSDGNTKPFKVVVVTGKCPRPNCGGTLHLLHGPILTNNIVAVKFLIFVCRV